LDSPPKKWRPAAGVLIERGEQALPRARQSLTHRVRRPPRDGREVARGKAVDVPKNDQDSILGGKDACEEVADGECLRRIGRRLATTSQPFERCMRPPSPAQRVESAVPRDAEEPRFRIANVGELDPLLEGGEKGLLKNVLGKRSVADDLHEELTKPLLGGDEKRLELEDSLSTGSQLDSTRRHILTLPHAPFL
jgi:hypothetical protein